MSESTLTDGSTPVGVTAKHPRHGVARPVVDLVSLTVDVHPPWLVLVLLGEPVPDQRQRVITLDLVIEHLRSNAEVTEELVLIQHLLQDPD